MKKIIFIILLLLAGFIFVLNYFGLFSSINFIEQSVGSFQLVYKDHKGAYSQTGKIQNDIYYSLLNDKIQTYKGFGIYYDNPKKTKTENLRSIAGCILEKSDYSKIALLKNKYQIKKFPQTKSIITTFPYKNSISIFAGIIKVYPELEKYIKNKGYKPAPVMEIYDIPNNKIKYIVPIIQ